LQIGNFAGRCNEQPRIHAAESPMSTFYLLPARPHLGRLFGQYLESVFPGLHWDHEAWTDLAESLGAAANRHAEVYVVYREDLPDDVEKAEALQTNFGAEPGDEIVEIVDVIPGKSPATRRWRLDAPRK
jgi:hypothetical protein